MQFNRLWKSWLTIINKVLHGDIFVYIVFFLSIIFAVITYVNFAGISIIDSKNVFKILYLDIALLLIAGTTVGYKIFKILYGINYSSNGYKFQKKLIVIFSSLVFIPTFIMAVFAVIFFHGGMDSWFTEKNRTVLQESLKVAESYKHEHQKVVLNEAKEISRLLNEGMPVLPEDEDVGNAYFNTMIELRSIASALIMDENYNVMCRTMFSNALDFIPIDHRDFESVKKNKAILLDVDSHKYVTALAYVDIGYEDKLGGVHSDPAYLLIRKPIDEEVIKCTERTKTAMNEYNALLESRWNLEARFALIFLVISLLLVFSAMGIAITVSSQLIRPIAKLIDATNEIKRGNLEVAVEANSDNEEMNILSRTFNEMAKKLNKQHTKLKEINKDLDGRIQFIENVLYGVSSGVIGLDANKEIYIYNKFASNLFNLKVGADVMELIPDIAELLNKALTIKETVMSANLELQCSNSIRILFFKVLFSKKLNGYIVTFDDLTEITIAQKKAAWSDVARKVAHEIKNPLTPIQISVERIFRKFSKEVKDKYILEDLTKTTINQVEIIKRLLNEFTMFSRMPEPVFKKINISDVINNILFLQSSANQNIKFIYHNQGEEIMMICDESLISQAFMNIIKNSINAINYEISDLKVSTRENYKIEISIKFDKGKDFIIEIFDNGPGFPDEYKDKLIDPYFSLMPKGTGLGLAIVNKIISEHNGTISFENRQDIKGAKVTLIIPQMKP